MAPSGRPRKACNTCKSQKIRCTEERPVCKRCLRLGHQCLYNDIRERPISTTQEDNHKIKRRRTEGNDPLANVHTGSLQAVSNSAQVDQYLGIPSSLLHQLVEVYYENVYNATLLLHKQTFQDSIAAGTVRPHVILSVCAFAAKFYENASGQPSLRDHGFMIEWAKRAGKLVLQEAEDLHEDNVVTFCNLALLWHSEGSWRIALLHKGNACQLLHIIGLGSKKLRTEATFGAEVQRRRFWACYLTHCHLGERTQPFEPNVMNNMALPWREDDFDNKTLAGTQTFLQRSEESATSIFEELARILTLWSDVASLVKSPPSNTSERLSAVHVLDQRLNKWWKRLPKDLKMYSCGLLFTTEHFLIPKKLLINVVYRQSLCILHASLVPTFSWERQEALPSTAIQLSAQIAYEQACKMSSLIGHMLDQYQPLSAMPSFVSYAAYCSTAIVLNFTNSMDADTRKRAQEYVRYNVKMIDIMSEYWKIASLLNFYVKYLIEVHKKTPVVLQGEPKYCELDRLIDFRSNAAHTRTSVVEFMGITRRDGDGYVKPGEEYGPLTEDKSFRVESPSRLNRAHEKDERPNMTQETRALNGDTQREANILSSEHTVSNQQIHENADDSEQLNHQYRPELLSFMGMANPNQLDLVNECQDLFNPFLNLQPCEWIEGENVPDVFDFDTSPLNLDYFDKQQQDLTDHVTLI